MRAQGARWWPLAVVVGLWLAHAAWNLGFSSRTGQEKVMATMAASALGLLLVVVWLLALSRLPWRRRLAVFGAVVLLGAALGGALRFRGVSGDLVPILEWRWRAASGVELAADAELARTADYPQFLGPRRDATVPGAALGRDWSAAPPREVWRRPVGEGWSAFAVAGGVAVTQEQDGLDETVVAYELATGRELWRHADRGRYDNPIAGVGPRATPTLDGGRVFTLGARGRLNALALADGRVLWTRDLAADFDSSTPEWGRPGSPLVVDGMVVVPVGGDRGAPLMAFDAASGEVAWRAGSDPPSYSSPTLLVLAGERQVVSFNSASVSGHAVATGAPLWSFPWPAEQPNVALPVAVGGDGLLVSSGYGAGAKLLRIERSGDGFAARLVWESPRLKAKFTNVVLHDGFVYGLDDGVLVCLDPATGERRWKSGRYGHGQVILAGDLLLVQSERGEVALLEPRPDRPRELGRFTAFAGKTWNPPALAGRYLVLRSHREAALFELPPAD